MPDNFLTTTKVDRNRWIVTNDVAALERFGALAALLRARVSAAAAQLFAEPLIGKSDREGEAGLVSVSWYTEAPGEGRPLDLLDEAAARRASARLGELLRELRPVLDDPDDGPLVAAALHLGGLADIWIVEGQPVFVNWGLLPEGGADVAARSAQYATTLGRFLPMAGAPPLTAEERRARSGAAMASAEAAQGTGAAALPPTAAVAPAARDAALSGRAWVPLAVLLALATLTLGWLLLPGTRIFPPVAARSVIDPGAVAGLMDDVNRELEGRRQALEQALNTAQCRSDGQLVLPDGRMLDGVTAPPEGGAEPAALPVAPSVSIPDPMVPPDPARVQVPGAGPATQPGDTLSLLEHLDERTVLVIAESAEGTSTGTGFFVTPTLVVTNNHVVEGSDPASIRVTSQALGGLHVARVIKSVGPLEAVGADFALLEVAGVQAKPFTLYKTATTLRLQGVISAGYPGDVLETDSAFAALRQGDMTAIPALTVTDGVVNTEQVMGGTMHVVVHSAPMSQGNSGGPLSDLCGRIVGVNTFVREGNLRNLNFALAVPDLIAFLDGTAAVPAISTEPCAPLVAAPRPMPTAPGATDLPAAEPAAAAQTAPPAPAPPAPAPGANADQPPVFAPQPAPAP